MFLGDSSIFPNPAFQMTRAQKKPRYVPDVINDIIRE